MRAPHALARRLRIAVYVLAALAIAYLSWRFDVTSLPEEGCSPLFAFQPGERLLVDLHGGRPAAGDAVLFRGPERELLLGRVDAPPPDADDAVRSALAAGSLWIATDATGCPSVDSERIGPIAAGAIAGRVVLVLPW